jgi:fucose permease
MDIFSNKHSLFALLVCFFGTYGVVDFNGFIASELIKGYQMEDHQVGYLFAAQAGVYLIMCLVFPFTFEHISRKL